MEYCPYCQTNREKSNYIDPYTQMIYSKCSTCSRIIQRTKQRQKMISNINETNKQQDIIQGKKMQTTKSGKAKLIIKKTPSSKSKTNKNSRSKTSSKTKNKTTKTKTKPIK